MRRDISKRQKTIGKLLLATSLIIVIIFAVLESFFTGLIIAVPIFACGLVCILKKEDVGLFLCWVIFFFIDIYIRYASGVTWRLIFLTREIVPDMNNMRLFFAWLELILFITMTVATIKYLKNKKAIVSKENRVLYIALWIIFIMSLMPVKLEFGLIINTILYIFLDWIRIALFIVLVGTINKK